MKPVTTVFEAAGSRIEVANYGGQILSWRAADGVERLYRPDLLLIESGRALRGGVPICFPQFSDRGPIMKHGFARLMNWQVGEQTKNDITFFISDDQATRDIWDYAFLLEQKISLSSTTLQIALKLKNTGKETFAMTNALHSYLRVDDIHTAQLSGLKNSTYEDALDNCQLKLEQAETLVVIDELDRVYCQPPSTLSLKQSTQKTMQITQQGFSDTVVWNPGVLKAEQLTDMPTGDWKKMLCVESAIAAKPFFLEAGQVWHGSQSFSILDS
jgi:glucose-6-phosphate 1-epimerase